MQVGLAQGRPPDLSLVSIEDLMNIEITSASRKEQRAGDVAAAVFVITQDDIRRSGMTTLPDLLRLVPGVEVAQINSNKWAVSVRGFNALYANKLLVLVDGRTIYSRIFSGVFWDTEDLLLDDIDRIEVIRGPGAAIWGANAVNGVINIVTRPRPKRRVDWSASTVGVSANREPCYGGTFGSAHLPGLSQWTRRHDSLIAPDPLADDASQSTTRDFAPTGPASPGVHPRGRFHGRTGTRALAQLQPANGRREPIANVASDTQGGHFLGRWTHTRAGGASLQIQSYVDIARPEEPVGDYERHAVRRRHALPHCAREHHDVVAGASYRFNQERFDGRVGFSLTPPR